RSLEACAAVPARAGYGAESPRRRLLPDGGSLSGRARLERHPGGRFHGGRPLSADVALLTEARFAAEAAGDDAYLANILLDDRLLADALRARGLTSARVDWARPDVDWSRYRCSMFRTIWIYVKRFPEFQAWLGRAERTTRVLNTPATVRWNWDKHYLADLEAQ